MRTLLYGLLIGLVSLTFSDIALAQSGHFIEKDTVCRDIGTRVDCSGKVAGLGGTTFQILVRAQGQAIVECRNPGGNVAPGQTTEITVLGSTPLLNTPRNGQYRFGITTSHPTAPSSSCPNNQWTPEINDVVFSTATLELYEDSVLVDSQTVNVQ